MIQGVGASPGVGLAPVMLWQTAVKQDYIPRKSEKPAVEVARFEDALTSVQEKTRGLCKKAALRFGDDETAIFDAYAMMLSDEDAVIKPTKELIRFRSLSAEYAVTLQFGELARSFLDMDSEYMRQRAEDVFNIRDALLREMMGTPVAEASHMDRPTIMVAHVIAPPDIVNMDLSRLQGIICEEGGYSSHLAIIARTLGIPTVLNVPGITTQLHDGDTVGMDGETGEIWLNPGEEEISLLRRRAEVMFEKHEEMQGLRGLSTVTTDGRRVELSANIGQMDEVDAALSADAESVGLFRTEIIHMAYSALPSEEEQFISYRTLLERLNGKAATVRTFDDGGNRPTVAPRSRQEANPALGYRGIRMSLGRPSFFRAQLRALLRASAYGSLKLMLPMISTLDELHDAKLALDSIKRELRREGVPFDEQLPVGLFINVPAAALMSEVFAAEVDFFSISVNDLIQFTIAADRGSPDLSYLYHMFHPAVLRLIKWTVDAAHHHSIPCNICGEAQGYDKVLPLLLGLGLDGFSINPSAILSSRRMLNRYNYAECKRLADETLQLHSYTEVEKALTRWQEAEEAAHAG